MGFREYIIDIDIYIRFFIIKYAKHIADVGVVGGIATVVLRTTCGGAVKAGGCGCAANGV